MKRTIYTLSVLFLSFALLQGCKKEEKPKLEVSSGDVVKYAKYAAAGYKEPELKTWGATLAKTESVVLLETLNVKVKGKDTEVAKIKLSDNSVLYLSASHLGDKPVVFIEETKAYVRNNASSKVYVLIPKGTIGFVLEENGEWIQVYVGKIGEKWVTKQWVNSGFTSEDSKVQDARILDESVSTLSSDKSKPDQLKLANENLNNLASSGGIFADLARNALGMENSVEEPGGMDEPGHGGPDMDMGTVNTAAGLKMRDKPDVSGNSIALIPDKTELEIIEFASETVTIAGKEGTWVKVKWNGQTGWVFGGFLNIVSP